MVLAMGRTRLASKTIGENAVKTFITIVNIIFQVCASKSEYTDQKDSDRRNGRKGKIIKISIGLNRYWIKQKFLKISEKLSKIREIHLMGT